MAKKSAKTEGVVVPLVWVGIDDVEIVFANQIIVQMGAPGHEDELVVTFGQLHPPVLLGGPELNRKKLEALQYVPVKPVAKLGTSAKRLREFIKAMEQVLANLDQATGKSRKRRT